MSAADLLAELEQAGIHLTRQGDALHVRAPRGVSLAPYRESIAANKPGLLDLLRERDRHPVGRDAVAYRVRVNQEPVEATRPPKGWDGSVPTGCGAALACRTLGPCPHFQTFGRCWSEDR